MSNEFYISHLIHACNEAQKLPEKIILEYYSYICETFTFNSDMVGLYVNTHKQINVK